MTRGRVTTGIIALAALACIQLAQADTAAASTVGVYWDRADHTGDAQSWSAGGASWTCDAAWYDAAANASTSNVGSTWNDRYSSARIGLASCGVVLYEHAGFTGMFYATPDKTLRYADLTNSGVNNMVTSITWS